MLQTVLNSVILKRTIVFVNSDDPYEGEDLYLINKPGGKKVFSIMVHAPS